MSPKGLAYSVNLVSEVACTIYIENYHSSDCEPQHNSEWYYKYLKSNASNYLVQTLDSASFVYVDL